jgi:Na+/H+-dicarboxylate symporter
VSSLIVGVASAPDHATVGRLGSRALVWFIVIVALSATIGVLVTPLAFSLVSVDPATLAGLSTGPSSSELLERARAVPGLAQWLIDLVPLNPLRAAVNDALLPLIVFSLLFGVALTHVEATRRAGVTNLFQGIQEATFVLVRWVLIAAPFGVFALAVPLAARMGLGAVGASIWYMVVVSVLCAVFIVLILYPLASRVGGIPIRDFARAAVPVQALAMGSRSSLATLPVMIEQMQKLGLRADITGFFLPLSASMFRAGAGIGITGGACFVAALYGVDLSAAQLATIAATTTLLSFSVPGIPAGSIVVMVPVLLAADVPIEAVGILIGLDTIPDMLRTTTNVTGTMAVAAALGGRSRDTSAPA